MNKGRYPKRVIFPKGQQQVFLEKIKNNEPRLE
jgi:hypothetical protein